MKKATLLRLAVAGAVTLASDAPDDRSVDVVCSTEQVNTYGCVIDQNGWDLARFSANPVVLFDHGLGPDGFMPIGRASNVRVEDGQLKARLTFASAAVSPIADRVLAGFREGVLNAVSVGMLPLEVEDGDVPVVRRAELWEVSVVAVPSDPGALREQQISTLSALRQFAKECKDTMNTKKIRSTVALATLAALAADAPNATPADGQPADPGDTASDPKAECAAAVKEALACLDEVLKVCAAVTVDESADDAHKAAAQSAIDAVNAAKQALAEPLKVFAPEAPADAPADQQQMAASLMAMTGTKSVVAALGVVAAGKAALDELSAVRAKQAADQQLSAAQERTAIIEKLTTEKRLTPAQRKWAETVDLAALKSFAAVAPVITALSTTTSTEPAKNQAKRWEDYSFIELDRLARTQPETYAALKADRDQRASR